MGKKCVVTLNMEEKNMSREELDRRTVEKRCSVI
jgi:hypothetical protein